MGTRQPQTIEGQLDISKAEQDIDHLQEKVNRLKATLAEVGITADSRGWLCADASLRTTPTRGGEKCSGMNMNEKIKHLRLERGMTLEQVGDLVGVGKSTVRKWESGQIANMRRDKIAKLAAALNTTPMYLMGWDDDPSTNRAREKGGWQICRA